jgi:hypothetical protein
VGRLLYLADEQNKMLLSRQSDPQELALHRQTATKRDFYRALDRYYALKTIQN